jgi:hypothetical protein
MMRILGNSRVKLWIKFNWLMLGSTSKQFCKCLWIFEFHKRWEISWHDHQRNCQIPVLVLLPMELIMWIEGDIWKYPASEVWLWNGSGCVRSGVGNTASQNDKPYSELIVYCVILVSPSMYMSFVKVTNGLKAFCSNNRHLLQQKIRSREHNP